MMVLRLVSGPMLESNRTEPLADRQKVLLTARLRVSLFLEVLTTRKRRIFKKFLGNLRDSRTIFSSLIILTFFMFSVFHISFLAF